MTTVLPLLTGGSLINVPPWPSVGQGEVRRHVAAEHGQPRGVRAVGHRQRAARAVVRVAQRRDRAEVDRREVDLSSPSVKPSILPLKRVLSSASVPPSPAKSIVLDIVLPPLAISSVPPAIVAPEIVPPDVTSS